MNLRHRNEADDAALIECCLAGDPAAWEALLRRYQGFIFHIPRRAGLSTADAEDVFQNVSLKLCLHLAQIKDPTRLAAWLGAVTRQECLRLRRRRPTESLDDAGEPADETALEEDLLRAERSHLVHRALAQLTDRCRALLDLLYGPEPIPYAQAARQLGVALGTIGPQRASCLERLRSLLQKMGMTP